MPKKREQVIQLALCGHIRSEYPDVVFYSDFAAGLKLPIWLAALRKAMASGRGIPDLMVDAKRGNFGGLRIEIKKEGERIYLKDGSISKDKHVQEQNTVLEKLRKEGYCAEFGIGLEQCQGIVDWYMAGADPGSLLLERSSAGEQRFTNTNTGEVF
ncbi:MAG: hypothetical protein WC426_13485 [Sulfuriferula sp.]